MKSIWHILPLICLLLAAGRASGQSVDDFVYSTNADNTTCTLDAYIGPGGPVTIPASFNALALTTINNDAFYESSISSVTVPSGVTNIAPYAFGDCFFLTNVSLPSSLVSLGSNAFLACGKLTNIVIPDSVVNIHSGTFAYCSSLKNVSMGDGVTNIGAYAFEDCYTLKNFNFPPSLASVGQNAFFFCDELSNVDIPDNTGIIGSQAFAYCSNLVSLTIGSSVTNLGAAAFENCSSLAKVAIPDSLTNFGASAFEDCYGLANVTFGRGVSYIPASAFQDCFALTNIVLPTNIASIGPSAFQASLLSSVSISSSVTNIGYQAFQDCGYLTNIIIPGSVNTIGSNAFFQSRLTTVAVPDSVTNMGSGVFGSCFFLTSVDIGDGLAAVPSGTFASCGSLTSIVIPDNIKSIGTGAFSFCTNLVGLTIGSGVTNIGGAAFEADGLASLSIPPNVTTIGSNSFGSCTNLATLTIPDTVSNLGVAAFENCQGLASLTIGSGLTSIGPFAFESCQRLKSVLIPASVTSIGSNAFAFCADLPEAIIPNSVTNIGASAFENCGSLTNLDLGSSVTNIGASAFEFCAGLRSVTFPGSVSSLGSYSFESCDGLSSVCFQGNAPANPNDVSVFTNDPVNVIFYVSGATNWQSTFDGIQTSSCTSCSDLAALLGGLQVTLTPSGAVAAGAAWQLGVGAYEKSGATVTNLVVGSHTISFKPVTGWNTPSNEVVTITNGEITKATGAYTPFIIGNPKLAITYPKSGQGLSNAAVVVTGTVTDKVAVTNVYFQFNNAAWLTATTSNSWSNWTASFQLSPAANTFSAYAADSSGSFSATNTVAIIYIVDGGLQVSLTPSAAVAAGARWNVDNGAYQTNGAVLTNLLVGTHSVSFKTVAGFTTPASQTVAISSNQLTAATGVYVESTKPSVTVSSPASGVRSTNVSMSGAASDALQIAGVNYWITNPNQPGDNLSGQALLSAGTTSSNWTIQASPLPGSNILAVQSLNNAGLGSPVATRAFFIQLATPLVIATSPVGWGTVNGTSSIKSDPAPSNGANLFIGEGYTVTAKPASGILFSNWMANGEVVSTNISLSFVMESNLTLQANFSSNLFASMAARYDGIFSRLNSEGLVATNSGLIANLQLRTNGLYTATLYLAGQSYSLHGAFDVSGQASETVSGLTLQMNLLWNDVPPRSISGSLSGPAWTATNLMLYAAQTNVQNVRYSMLIAPAGESNSPPGYGYVLITNSDSSLTLGGALADGSTFSQSAALGEDGEFPLYANLYSGGGVLLARLSPASASFAATNTVNWVRFAAKTGLYTNGFNLEPEAQDSAVSATPGLLTNLFGSQAQLEMSGPGLSNNLVFTLEVTTNNTLTPMAGQTNLASVRLNPANELMTVVLTNDAGKKVTAYGTVLQNFNLGGGYFIGTTNAGVMTLISAP